MPRKIGVMEFYGHLNRLSCPEFPMFPSFSGAQMHDYLTGLGFSTEHVPLTRSLTRDPETFRLFFEKDTEEHDHDIFTKVFQEIDISNIDTLCVCYNYTTDSEAFNNFLGFIRRQRKDLRIILISFFSQIRSQDRLLKEGAIDDVLCGQDILGKLRAALLTDRTENKWEFRTRKLYSASYSADDVHTKKLFYNNLYKNFRPDPFSEIELPVSKSIGCKNGCLYCPFSMDAEKDDILGDPVDGIERIKNETGAKYFYIVQNDICHDEKSIKEFCDTIITRNLDIMWTSPVEAKRFLSEDIFAKMHKAGCKKVMFGVDTASEKLIELYRRKTDLNTLRDSIMNCSKSGIFVEAFVLVGLPGETEEDFRKTIDFCKSIEKYVDHWIVSGFFLSERSMMFDRPEEFGIKIGEPVKEFNFEDPSYDVSFPGSMIDLGFHGRKYSYSLEDGTGFEELQQMKEKRSVIFKEMLRNDKDFSFASYDHLRSIEKADELLKYTRKMKTISVGLSSNQDIPGTKNKHIKKDHKFVTMDYFRFIIDRSMRLGEKKYLITGGEPLIHPRIPDFMRYLKKNGADFVIKTNARMLSNEKFCARIAKLADRILVIDPANNEEDYEKLSMVKGSWRQSREGIENWKRNGKRVIHFMR
ncbi:MAG: radical SAM protein [Candidatus Woesearchaeota archaeon]